MRPLWFVIGLTATACGFAGAVLPLVPTTPFLLLAAFAFARSSPRLHDWLVSHPILGPPIDNWRAHGAIAGRVKVLAVIVMLATLAASLLAGLDGWIIGLQAGVMALAAAFIVTRPSGPA
jgi:uncharacterized membrane protein YbaN (DUF454 family)